MASKKAHNEQEDQGIDLPEDRLEKVSKVDKPKDDKKKTRQKSAKTVKGKQAKKEQDAAEVVDESPSPINEDPLSEVRQSLLEDEKVEEEKEQRGLFARFKNGLKKLSKSKEIKPEIELETESELEPEVDVEEDLEDTVVVSKPEKKRGSRKQEEKAIQEFFADLDALASVTVDEPDLGALKVDDALTEKEPEKKEQVKRLPKKTDSQEDVDFEKIRDVALQEYDETVIEPEKVVKTPLREEVRTTIRELKPIEKIFLFGFAALTVIALLSSGAFLIASAIPKIPTATPTATPDLSKITYPIRVILPGGWKFDLAQGYVIEGEWIPQGGEWLMGTEISRWVALPWSVQLEAVLRTLKSGDQVELLMSNYDTLSYSVYSIQEMSMGEILALDARIPSLVVVLFDGQSEEGLYWVVTAFPGTP